MLILNRRVGEKIVISGNVYVEVVNIQGGAVKLGITAPKEIPVHREEILRDNHRPDLHGTSKDK